MGGRRFLVSVVAAIAIALIAAPAAQATFHLIKVREVFPGGRTPATSSCRCSRPGRFSGRRPLISVYNSTGRPVHTSIFPEQCDQLRTTRRSSSRTAASHRLPAAGPDEVDTNPQPCGRRGAVCWNRRHLRRTASPGATSPGRSLTADRQWSPSARPSPRRITSGKAFRRTIEPGCSTLLEESDDSERQRNGLLGGDADPARQRHHSDRNDLHGRATQRSTTSLHSDEQHQRLNSPITPLPRPATSFECKLDVGEPLAPASTGGLNELQRPCRRQPHLPGARRQHVRPRSDPRQLHLDGRHGATHHDDRHPPRGPEPGR